MPVSAKAVKELIDLREKALQQMEAVEAPLADESEDFYGGFLMLFCLLVVVVTVVVVMVVRDPDCSFDTKKYLPYGLGAIGVVVLLLLYYVYFVNVSKTVRRSEGRIARLEKLVQELDMVIHVGRKAEERRVDEIWRMAVECKFVRPWG
jgi:hypothetical protein